MAKCYFQIYSERHCKAPAVYKQKGLGAIDYWTWCEEHAPDPDWREPLENVEIQGKK